MIQKTIVSFFDTVKQKSTNPFLGTLVLVWIFRNYNDLYVLLFSGDSTTYVKKLESLHNLYHGWDFILSLLVTVAITVLVIVLTYILLNVSRLIVNFSNKKVTPWVYKITDKSSIVLKEKFDKILDENERLQKKYEDERMEKIRIKDELEKSEKERSDLLVQLNNPSNVQLEKEMDEIQNDLDSSPEVTPPDRTPAYIIQQIKKRGYETDLEELIFNHNANKEWITGTKGVHYFNAIGILEILEFESRTNKLRFQLSDYGITIMNKYTDSL